MQARIEEEKFIWVKTTQGVFWKMEKRDIQEIAVAEPQDVT